jgi:redox-sensitive bicupin YhaK (pirin superfamily)
MHELFENPRSINNLVVGTATQDGAGVQLTRLIATSGLPMLDPFLLLDVFCSNNPNDYIAGFPPHPHRGFETVTYLLAGCVRHRDSASHSGIVKAGGVQWMTAGRGVQHSEMPEQEEGLLEGFQLWVNLPAAHKMDKPRYQELEPNEIPEEIHENGTQVRVIAGRTVRGTEGAVTDISVSPLYLDVQLPAGTVYQEIIPLGHNAFIYQIAGESKIVNNHAEATNIPDKHLAVLGEGNGVIIEAISDSRFLLIAGKPIGEPVARHGPFVMNTTEEIEQAYQDYRSGLFGEI